MLTTLMASPFFFDPVTEQVESGRKKAVTLEVFIRILLQLYYSS